MNQNKLRIVVGMSLCLAFCAGAFAQDWPQWRGPARDGALPNFDVPQVWPESINKAWSVDVGRGVASPALVDDKLYVFARQGGDEVILCLNAMSGDEIWRYSYPEDVQPTGGARDFPGPRSSPAVAEGKVVTIGLAGVVTCVTADSGKLAWSKDPFPDSFPQFQTGTSPLIESGTAIVHVGKTEDGAVIAYDLASGEEKWRWTEIGPEYSSPVVAEIAGVKQVIVLSNKKVLGLDFQTGRTLWSDEFSGGRMSTGTATPIVMGDTVIYTVRGGGCLAKNIEKSEDGYTVTEKWKNPDAGASFSTATVNEGKLFLVSERGGIFCINVENGETIWSLEEPIDRQGFASMVAAGPVMTVLPTSGEIIIFDAKSDEYKELARYKVADTVTYAHPIPSVGGAYVKDQSTLSFWTGQ